MNSDKENDLSRGQRGSSISGTYRHLGAKSVLRTTITEGTQRKPFGCIQNVCRPSTNDDKMKAKKSMKSELSKDVRCKKGMGIDMQPNSLSSSVGGASTSAICQSAEDNDIERMHSEVDIEDDFSDLCATPDQPAFFVNELLCWYPCSSYEPQSPGSPPECSAPLVTPPEWKRKDSRSEELIQEPKIPEFRLLDGVDFHF